MKKYYLSSFIGYVIIGIVFNIIEYYNLTPINIYIQYIFLTYYSLGTLTFIIGSIMMYSRPDLAYYAITYRDFTLEGVRSSNFNIYDVYELLVMCLIYKYFNCIEIMYVCISFNLTMDICMKYANHVLDKYE